MDLEDSLGIVLSRVICAPTRHLRGLSVSHVLVSLKKIETTPAGNGSSTLSPIIIEMENGYI